MRHLLAVRQRIVIRGQVEMKEAGLTGSEEAALVPLRDVMVVPGLLICHVFTWFVLLVNYHTTIADIMEFSPPNFRCITSGYAVGCLVAFINMGATAANSDGRINRTVKGTARRIRGK